MDTGIGLGMVGFFVSGQLQLEVLEGSKRRTGNVGGGWVYSHPWLLKGNVLVRRDCKTQRQPRLVFQL